MSDATISATGTAGPTVPPRRDYAMFDAELSGQMFNLQLLRRLMHWVRPYRRSVLLSIILVLIGSALRSLMPLVQSVVVIDHILLPVRNLESHAHVARHPINFGLPDLNDWLSTLSGWHPLLVACAVFLTLLITEAVTGHFQRMALVRAVVGGLKDLRRDLFIHIETRPSSFFDRVAVGRVMTRVTNDVEALFEMLRGMGDLFGEFVPFFVALAVMLAVSVKMTLILLMVLPVLGVITYYFRRATRHLFRMVRSTVSQLNQNMQENLSGLAVVQISGRQQVNLQRYTAINEKNRYYENRSMVFEVLYGAFNDSVSGIAIAMILYFGGGEVVQREMSLGHLFLFTQFINQLFYPVVALGQQLNVMFRAMASGERIFQALDWDEAIHEPAQPAHLPARLRGELRIERLSFAYDPDVPVLRDVSFTIQPGEKLAIVGPTGSGKSTIIRLLGRFYDFPDGMIFLDDIDLNRIHTSDLRKRIGVVLQDFHIFSGSIFDNIAVGNPHVTRQRAIAAATTVNAHSFINALPNGYDTVLSERGGNLSQGQRQLLAFARVLAADPEILILDEATASIDTETELLIQDALRKLTQGRTSILIAHRLQTIQEADRVLVLHHGAVAELGTHEELLAMQGLYYTLHTLQFQDISTDEADAIAGERGVS